MPSSMTHGYFCEDVGKKVNIDVKKVLKKHINYFKVFGQGPDPYFFYNFHLTKKSKYTYLINKTMQHSKINVHFIRLINYINEKDYYYNPEVMTYLYGQICHFVLDSTVHPFIIYNTGNYDEKNKETHKYNGLHEEMEYYIDSYLIFNREKILPKDYKIYKKLFNIGKFGHELNDVIDTVMKDVYGFENVSKTYYKCIMDMKKFYYVFNYDKYGVKKIVYSIMDMVCGNKCVKKKELSFYIKPDSKSYYLNNEKNIWNHPCNINEKYNYSFMELYDIATNRAVNIINNVDEMLRNKNIDNKKIKLLFKNQDYGTGKDANLNLVYKYFKF